MKHKNFKKVIVAVAFCGTIFPFIPALTPTFSFAQETKQSLTQYSSRVKQLAQSVIYSQAGIFYAIKTDGSLSWYEHYGYPDGSWSWSGPKTIGSGWQNFKQVFSGGNGVIYAIQTDGSLLWYKHNDPGGGSSSWSNQGMGKKVGSSWQNFKQVFSNGNGIIYAIKTDGSLLWYKHNGYTDGSWSWSGPKTVGSGWQNFKQVFSGGNGIIYAIDTDGSLWWYEHKGYTDGSLSWSGPKKVGTGWQNFKKVLSSGGNGVIYAIDTDGLLWWYKHKGYTDGSLSWSGPKKVGTGWQNFKDIPITVITYQVPPS